MAAKIEGRVRELLERPNFAAVATLEEDGTPAVNVVWAAVDNGHVVLNSAEGRKWPENVRRDERVTVVVVNRESPYEYAQIRGRVVEDTHEGADENIDELAKKYLGKDEYPFRQPGEQRILFRIEPERVTLHGG
jgi:PPOX class probable F420-dependent enzyme